ncbi:MAG: O-antigen ligase family protein [Pseudomonadota bacterium]
MSRTRGLAWILFYATSFQLAFLQPYVVLIPGERANLFSGLLCALSLGATCLVARQEAVGRKSPALQISLVLATLIILSGVLSSTPGSSSARGFVLLASGLGGFWGARVLLNSESRQKTFVWIALIMLAGILLISLISYLKGGSVYRPLDSNPHPLASRILLLGFAPLVLCFGPSGRLAKIAAGLLLGLGYLILFLSGLQTAVLIPPILCVIATFFGGLRLRYLLALFIPLLLIITYFFFHLPSRKMGKEVEPVYYRLENYGFSWSIAVKHPVLGIGLRAPREEFLNDYEIRYPYVTREKFANSVKGIRTSDNIFLTFMADLGFPFLLLYSFSMIVLLIRLVRRVVAPASASFPPPLALLLPISAGLLYFQVYDGLLFPQISWFFHILLGLIPPAQGPRELAPPSLPGGGG